VPAGGARRGCPEVWCLGRTRSARSGQCAPGARPGRSASLHISPENSYKTFHFDHPARCSNTAAVLRIREGGGIHSRQCLGIIRSRLPKFPSSTLPHSPPDEFRLLNRIRSTAAFIMFEISTAKQLKILILIDISQKRSCRKSNL